MFGLPLFNNRWPEVMKFSLCFRTSSCLDTQYQPNKQLILAGSELAIIESRTREDGRLIVTIDLAVEVKQEALFNLKFQLPYF